ncbi:peptide-methionine (S)-S-oxide reductase [Pustulibacterium marinum]|uniref:Peptide methionine sulfoxide reductase MsrA n=1 Tax=Pustulibacterium marinum TaxID=1224947 RepID=A0A1I7HLX8_9FLAO|nr:peptide-methionine (S)-S-oxide reductase MsrA [Pustulibacterium marinum]SFU61708.1 peptide-methionine (S)-S-oxide reductase [Pustulibacterium marinum]
MKKFIIIPLVLFSAIIGSCNTSTKENKNPKKVAEAATSENHTNSELENKDYAKAYFASGCFWCVEAIYESIDGVQEAVSGYSGGDTIDPTYREVSAGTTGHAETVEVMYDPTKVSFETLVKAFFDSHDPTTLNQQGPDHGTQYRSVAFYQTPEEKRIIENYIAQLTKAKAFNNPIVTEVKKFEIFWPAENYHQDFEERNPFNPYVKGVSKPRLERFKDKFYSDKK